MDQVQRVSGWTFLQPFMCNNSHNAGEYKQQYVVLAQEGRMWDIVVLVQKGHMWDMDVLVQEGCM